MIVIKDYKVLRALMEQCYHPNLIAMAMWIAHRYSTMTVTSAWRPEKVHSKDSGIHCTIPGRALDWSVQGLSNPKAIEEDINDHWEYDPTRPNMKCAILHDVGLGMHLHTQVHDLTVYHKQGKGDVV